MDADDLNNFLKNVKISPIQSALDHLHDLSDEDTKILESIRERTEFDSNDMDIIKPLFARYRDQIPDDIFEAFESFSERIKTPDIIAPIDPDEDINAKIWNGEFGKIVYSTPKRDEVIVRWNGYILGVVLTDEKDNLFGLKYRYNEIERTVPPHVFVSMAKQMFFLPSGETKKLREIIDSYMQNEKRNDRFTEGGYSPIYVKDDKIVVEYPDVEIGDVLKQLREYHDKSTKPEAYRSMLSFCLLAPLHYYLKKKTLKGLQTPLMLLSGKTGSGKTPMTYIFIGKGYGMQKEEYVFGLNMIDKIFTFTSFLSATNIPIVLDDIGMGWVVRYHEHLKSYMQSPYFGARGNSDQTVNIYKGVASFIMTMNDDFVGDSDPAFTKRLIFVPYTERDSEKVDKPAYMKFMETIPDGFMYMITRKILHGMDINELLDSVENFGTADDWVNFGIDLINNECLLHGIDPFPKFKSGDANGSSYVREVLEAMITEWERGKGMSYSANSYTYGNIDVEASENGDILDVYFTSLGLKKTLKLIGDLPYHSAVEFINAIMKTQSRITVIKSESGNLLSSRRIDGKTYPMKVYHIRMENEKI